VDHQCIIVCVVGHLSDVPNDMAMWIGRSVVFVKIWYFELLRNLKSGYQA
jgi:hypothetical protein